MWELLVNSNLTHWFMMCVLTNYAALVNWQFGVVVTALVT